MLFSQVNMKIEYSVNKITFFHSITLKLEKNVIGLLPDLMILLFAFVY